MSIWDFWTQQNWGCDKKGNCNYVRVCVRINVREYATIVRLRVRIQVWLHVRIHVKLCLSLHVRVVSLCQNMYIYIWYIYNDIYIMYKCTHTSHNSQIQFSQRIHVRQESQRMYMPWIMSYYVMSDYESLFNMSLLCHLWWGSHKVNWFRCLWLTLHQPQGIGASPERCLVRRDGHLMGQRVTGQD